MAQVTFDNSNALAFAGVDAEMVKATDAAAELLYNGQGAGNDFIGWVNLPSSITADELAKNNGTIGYEMICAIGERVPRFYIKDHEIVFVKDNIVSYEISE